MPTVTVTNMKKQNEKEGNSSRQLNNRGSLPSILEEERRKGLASITCSKLILSCLDDGLYPSWDAANMESVKLAEKLGYEFSHEYSVYCVSRT